MSFKTVSETDGLVQKSRHEKDTLNMCIDQVKGHNDTQSRWETISHRQQGNQTSPVVFFDIYTILLQ